MPAGPKIFERRQISVPGLLAAELATKTPNNDLCGPSLCDSRRIKIIRMWGKNPAWYRADTAWQEGGKSERSWLPIPGCRATNHSAFSTRSLKISTNQTQLIISLQWVSFDFLVDRKKFFRKKKQMTIVFVTRPDVVTKKWTGGKMTSPSVLSLISGRMWTIKHSKNDYIIALNITVYSILLNLPLKAAT